MPYPLPSIDDMLASDPRVAQSVLNDQFFSPETLNQQITNLATGTQVLPVQVDGNGVSAEEMKEFGKALENVANRLNQYRSGKSHDTTDFVSVSEEQTIHGYTAVGSFDGHFLSIIPYPDNKFVIESMMSEERLTFDYRNQELESALESGITRFSSDKSLQWDTFKNGLREAVSLRSLKFNQTGKHYIISNGSEKIAEIGALGMWGFLIKSVKPKENKQLFRHYSVENVVETICGALDEILKKK